MEPKPGMKVRSGEPNNLHYRRLKESILKGICTLDELYANTQITPEQRNILVRSFTEKIQAENTRQKEEIRHLREMVGSDQLLSDLLNRSFLTSILEGYIRQLNQSYEPGEKEKRKTPPPESLMIVVLDIDEFKSINDTYGHPAGDRVLLLMAKRLKEATRPGDSIFRIGGDEFLALLPLDKELNTGTPGKINFEKLFETISSEVNKDLFIEIEIEEEGKKIKKKVPFTVSIGFDKVEKGTTDTAEDIIEKADKKMYKAKNVSKRLKK